MVKFIRAIIIDDEPKSIKVLKASLEKHCAEVSVVAEAQNITDGFVYINDLEPDLIFLDINMPNGSGFDLLTKMKKGGKVVRVIFTTAHDEYAIKALRFSAIDYLLKPIDKEDLINAIRRFKGLDTSIYSKHLDILHQLIREKKRPEKITIYTTDSIHLVAIDEIFYLASEKNYTHIFFEDTAIVASKSLRVFEELLVDYPFLRVHRSYLINLNKVVEYQKKVFKVQLSNGTLVDVARNKKDKLSEKLQNMNPAF